MVNFQTMSEEMKKDFIRERIDHDNESGRFEGKVVTRFPPEPNGYLHIGHAKSICLNFGVAQEYQRGPCHLRFDDTNPAKEEQEYVDSIKEDVRWLGFDWNEQEFFASNYFDQLYGYAVQLIKKGHAYVCDISGDDWAEYRGVPTEPGKESPNRNRSIEENLTLFQKMKEGEFEEGAYVLRAKIDMTSPNLHLRDPALYRIKKASHHRTGEQWCIYPMYDFAHCLSDSIEEITHSLCTLEFEVHRPLYDWILDTLGVYHPQQIEFARLNLTYTVLSKRKLLQLVEEGHVESWDDPRMPTLSGLRRKGYTPAAIRQFCDTIGIAKRENTIELPLLEHALRSDLEQTASRAMVVFDPLKVVITNYDDTCASEISAPVHPADETRGTRTLPFTKELFIERADFMLDPPKKFFRLAPEKEVRLRNSYIIKCNDVIKNESGEISELHCTLDPETLGANPSDGRKVKGVIHWVSATSHLEIEARLYENLFLAERPDEVDEGASFTDHLNPDSLKVVTAYAEPSLGSATCGQNYQFERVGYFCPDNTSTPEQPVFNKTVNLKDSWGKKQS
ncbi:MAG: glutamine--tRNA ligase/YqeY domain fusion protein [Verrucomicrobiota bacterium]